MKDGLPLRALKAVVRGMWAAELGVRRAVARLRGRGYRLAGACGGCARCCERPTIRGGPFTLHVPAMRRLFLGWQQRVNGFELVEMDVEAEQFVFRCAHFDWASRRCDSYASRPYLCRDYPRALLDQPSPELFPECGFRPVARNAARMQAALDAQGLPPEVREGLERKLYLK